MTATSSRALALRNETGFGGRDRAGYPRFRWSWDFLLQTAALTWPSSFGECARPPLEEEEDLEDDICGYCAWLVYLGTMLVCGVFFEALGDLDKDRNWVGLGHRQVGGSVGGVLWDRLSSWCVLFLSPAFSLLFVLGGSGVLSHGAVFGLFFLFISFLFSFLCGHWDIHEH